IKTHLYVLCSWLTGCNIPFLIERHGGVAEGAGILVWRLSLHN
ncbi:unnamed protein product, partial [Prunus brigantina]